MAFTIREPRSGEASAIADVHVATWKEDEALGDGPAMLWVAKENPRATAVYRRNGFRFDGVEQIDPHAPLITDARMLR